MNKDKINILEDYAEIEAQIKELEEKKEAMKPKVLTLLEKRGVDTLQEAWGTYSIVYRKKWAYSDEYGQRKEQYDVILKGLRSEEEEQGIAKAEDVKNLSYRAYQPK